MKLRLLIIALAICMLTTPAMADLFGFTVSNLSTTYDNTTNQFTSEVWANTTADLYRNISPVSTAEFSGPWTGSEDFSLQMTLTNITALTAVATGSFSFFDTDGDLVSGNISGTWANISGFPFFSGTLSNVLYTSVVNTTFDGHSGSASMVFNAPQPWSGAIFQLTSQGSWFSLGPHEDVKGGSIDASVVPVPAAFILGILGLSIAGIKLRKYA